MRPRYILLVSEGPRVDAALVNRLRRHSRLRVAFSNARVAALANDACPCIPLGNAGCVLGAIFHRHGGARAVATIDPPDVQAILDSRGATLLTKFWGGYVAAIGARSPVRVMRDPSGALPAYFATRGGVAAFGPDADGLAEAGFVAPDIDWEALGRHFHGSGVPSPTTAITGVRELLPGFGLDLPGSYSDQLPCWSPWDHVSRGGPQADDASDRLARTVRHCVASWASAGGHVLLSCSGGLDSSIVAAALARSGTRTTCLTMYAEDAAGDERSYAREMCAHLGLPLIERPYRLDQIRLGEALSPHLPRPSDRMHALSYERTHLEVAEEVGADSFMTGNGGDSVFGYSQSAAAASDRYLSEGLGAGVLHTLRDISVQTGCGIPRAALAAVRIARRRRAYRCRPDPMFLNSQLADELARTAADHPWLDAPPDALPGKAAHIASVLRIQQCLEASRGRYLPVLNPLMSQPLVEACFAVPAWEWRTGGRDRSLARSAFSSDLPPAIIRRRVKGGPDGFAARVIDRFREEIRARLLDGRLAAHRIIDRRAVERSLDSRVAMGGEERARLLEFAAAEAWIDSWISRKAGLANERAVSGRVG